MLRCKFVYQLDPEKLSLSDGQFVNSLSRCSKITERNTTDKYVLRQEFKVEMIFFRERSEIGKIVKFVHNFIPGHKCSIRSNYLLLQQTNREAADTAEKHNLGLNAHFVTER